MDIHYLLQRGGEDLNFPTTASHGNVQSHIKTTILTGAAIHKRHRNDWKIGEGVSATRIILVHYASPLDFECPKDTSNVINSRCLDNEQRYSLANCVQLLLRVLGQAGYAQPDINQSSNKLVNLIVQPTTTFKQLCEPTSASATQTVWLLSYNLRGAMDAFNMMKLNQSILRCVGVTHIEYGDGKIMKQLMLNCVHASLLNVLYTDESCHSHGQSLNTSQTAMEFHIPSFLLEDTVPNCNRDRTFASPSLAVTLESISGCVLISSRQLLQTLHNDIPGFLAQFGLVWKCALVTFKSPSSQCIEPFLQIEYLDLRSCPSLVYQLIEMNVEAFPHVPTEPSFNPSPRQLFDSMSETTALACELVKLNLTSSDGVPDSDQLSETEISATESNDEKENWLAVKEHTKSLAYASTLQLVPQKEQHTLKEKKGAIFSAINDRLVKSEQRSEDERPKQRSSLELSVQTRRGSFDRPMAKRDVVQSAPIATTSRTTNEVYLPDIVAGRENRTSIMLKNVPNRYTQDMMIEFLNETHEGLYDFVYLRMDFLNRCNVGYAFINFVNPMAVVTFAARISGQKWPKFNSDKIPSLCFANIQGKEAFIDKFRNSNVMSEEKAYRPRIFKTFDISLTGPCQPIRSAEEEEFPPPTTGPLKPKSTVLFSRVKTSKASSKLTK